MQVTCIRAKTKLALLAAGKAIEANFLEYLQNRLWEYFPDFHRNC
jgi:hypothetical protein